MPDFLRKSCSISRTTVARSGADYSTYHVENEQVFYNREDIWTVAQQGREPKGQGPTDAIEPFFVLMTFPADKAPGVRIDTAIYSVKPEQSDRMDGGPQ